MKLILILVIVLGSIKLQAADSLEATSEALIAPVEKLSDISEPEGLTESQKNAVPDNFVIANFKDPQPLSLQEMLALDNEIFSGNGSGMEDFREYKYFYKKSRFSLWGSYGQDKSASLRAIFKAGYIEYLQKSSPTGRAFVGVGFGLSKFDYEYTAPKVRGDSTQNQYRESGNGNELRLNLSVNSQRASNSLSSLYMRFGVIRINQESQNKQFKTESEYTNLYMNLESNMFSDPGRTTFNRTKFTFEYRYPLVASSEMTDRVTGEVKDGFVYNHKMFFLRLEQNILSVPLGRRIAVTAAAVLQYRHLSQDEQDLYAVGGLFSLFHKYTELLQLSVTQEFDPSNRTKDNYVTQYWVAINVPVVIEAFGVNLGL